MIPMNETEFVAHALTDYLSAFVDRSLIMAMHQSLLAGEAESAIGFALGVAVAEEIPLPSLVREKILSLSTISEEDVRWFRESLTRIPLAEIAA